jgi:hypothetical protein
MEVAKDKTIQVEEHIDQEVLELNNHQLALVGGGIGDVIVG